MPRKINGLYDQIITFENLYGAYKGASKAKRYRIDRMRYAEKAEENLVELQNHLIWKSWSPGRQREFLVREPKRRLIQAPPFHDRVLHHALTRVVEPIFEPRFIYDSYACRKGKGTQRAVIRTQHFVQVARRNWGDDVYVLKADISRYFASIRHDILMTEIARVIGDDDVLWLWSQILLGYGHEGGVGIPVGALTSQLGANIMLNRLDHIAKDELGLKHYIRYMDDFVAVLPNKAEAQRALRDLGDAVNGLALSLNPKTGIHPWQRGVDFCGYRIWPTHVLPRKRNIKRARRDFQKLKRDYQNGKVGLDEVRQRVMSFLAYAKHCNAQRTVEGVLGDLVLIADAGRQRQTARA